MKNLFYFIPIISLCFINILQIFYSDEYFEKDYHDLAYVIVFISSLYLADINRKILKEWSYLFLGVAILYNPFLLFIFRDEVLLIINFIVIFLYIANLYLFASFKTYKKTIENNVPLENTTNNPIKNNIPLKNITNSEVTTNKYVEDTPKWFKADVTISETHYPNTVIGIGGGGSNIVQELNNIESNKYNTLIVNSDINALNMNQISNKLYLYKDDGLGCGGNVNCGFNLVRNDTKESLERFAHRADNIFLIATLGGGVGTGATEAIVNHFLSKQKKIVVFMVLPFKWEGKKKNRKVMNMLERLPTSNYNLTICLLHNQDLHETYQDKSMRECFSIINNAINTIILTKKYKLKTNIVNIELKGDIPIISDLNNLKDLYV